MAPLDTPGAVAPLKPAPGERVVVLLAPVGSVCGVTARFGFEETLLMSLDVRGAVLLLTPLAAFVPRLPWVATDEEPAVNSVMEIRPSLSASSAVNELSEGDEARLERSAFEEPLIEPEALAEVVGDVPAAFSPDVVDAWPGAVVDGLVVDRVPKPTPDGPVWSAGMVLGLRSAEPVLGWVEVPVLLLEEEAAPLPAVP